MFDYIILNLNRIARVGEAITGHLQKMRLSNTSECTCGLEEETGIHVICDIFSQLIRRILGEYAVTPSEILKRDLLYWKRKQRITESVFRDRAKLDCPKLKNQKSKSAKKTVQHIV